MERPPCTACRIYKRPCADECVFSPFIEPGDETKIEVCEKIFGRKKVERMIRATEPSLRRERFEIIASIAETKIHARTGGLSETLKFFLEALISLKEDVESIREYVSRQPPTNPGADARRQSSRNLSERSGGNAVGLDGMTGPIMDRGFMLYGNGLGYPFSGQTNSSTSSGSNESMEEEESDDDDELNDDDDGAF